MPRQFDEERIISSTNCAGKTRYPHAKEWTCTPLTHHVWKLKWNNDLNRFYDFKTLKPLEEQIGINLHYLGVGNRFLDVGSLTTKAWATKENKTQIVLHQN